MSKHQVEIYSDGSGNSLDSDGGWGYVIVMDGKKLNDGCGYMKSATNNTAELTAAIQGFKQLTHTMTLLDIHPNMLDVVLVSDSQLVLNYANGSWKCKKEHLKHLRDEVKNYLNYYKATTRWVKGHNGDEHNERCDELAGRARRMGRKRYAAINFCITLVKLDIMSSIAIQDIVNKIAPQPRP